MPMLTMNQQQAIREIVTPERARFDERERQQLPELFPEVVDNVLPKMLPDITAKYVPVLFEHLRQPGRD